MNSYTKLTDAEQCVDFMWNWRVGRKTHWERHSTHDKAATLLQMFIGHWTTQVLFWECGNVCALVNWERNLEVPVFGWINLIKYISSGSGSVAGMTVDDITFVLRSACVWDDFLPQTLQGLNLRVHNREMQVNCWNTLFVMFKLFSSTYLGSPFTKWHHVDIQYVWFSKVMDQSMLANLFLAKWIPVERFQF